MTKKNEVQSVVKEEEIVTLKSSLEAVRKLPDMFIGAIGNVGFMNMIREIVQNSLDCIAKGYTNNKNIVVSYDAIEHVVIVEDNGPGIPLDKLVEVFATLYSSSNYDKKAGSGNYSAGKNGAGSSITNYLSRFFNVESRRIDGSAGRVEFIEGELSPKGLQKIKPNDKPHGLMTIFAPSSVMGDITVQPEEVGNLLWEQCHIYPIGTRIVYNYMDMNGEQHSYVIDNKRGLSEMLESICSKPLLQPIMYQSDNGSKAVEVSITYDIENMNDPFILAFANMCHTSSIGSTHVDGTLDAVIKYFRDYMNKTYIPTTRNKKLVVNAQDVKTGFRAVITCKSTTPLYTGQSKDVYSETEMKSFAYSVAMGAIDNWAKSNPQDLQKLCKYFKDICELRSNIDNQKIKLSNNYQASVLSGLPYKFKRPINMGKGQWELWLLEGDSAASGLQNERGPNNNIGLMPLKGKIKNPFTTPPRTLFENDEISAITRLCGYSGYNGKKFDPELFRPAKVVFGVDSDSDGSHIACLLLGFFLRYMPFAFGNPKGDGSDSRIFVARPPLYGYLDGKKMRFFSNNLEYVEFVQSKFCEKHTIADNISNKKLTREQITKLLYINHDYVELLDHIASKYAIDPYLLELLLLNKDLNYSKLKKLIEKTYRFLTVSKSNEEIMISGILNDNHQRVFFNERFLSMCKSIIDAINKNIKKYYLLDGELMSIYGIMTKFNELAPAITRYKGLGEMKPELLASSTVLPGYGRCLYQYTIKDAQKELKTMIDLQSDKSKFLENFSGKIRREDVE